MLAPASQPAAAGQPLAAGWLYIHISVRD